MRALDRILRRDCCPTGLRIPTPALDIDFTDPASDGLYTFSRASGGGSFRPVGYSDELAVNGDFSNGLTGWQQTGTAWSIVDGAAKSDGTNSFLFQDIPSGMGRLVEFSFDVVNPGSTGSLIISLSNGGTTQAYSVAQLGGPTRKVIVGQITVNNRVYLGQSQSWDGAIDNVSVKEIILDRDGDPIQYFIAPAGVRCRDYDPVTGEKLGVAFWAQRMNLLPNSSNNFVTLTSGGGTVTVERAVHPAPDGSNSASRCITTRGTGYGLVGGNVSGLSLNTNYTYSCWLKSASGTQTIAFYNNSTGFSTIVIDDVWRRYVMPPAIRTDTTNFYRWIGSITASTPSNDFFIWGEQWETGQTATSYMPTGAAAATRAADIARISGEAFEAFYNQSEGTWLVEATADNLPLPGSSRSFVDLVDDNELNRYFLGYAFLNSTRFFVRSGGITQADISVARTTGAAVKMAATYKENNFQQATNGVLGVGDSSGTLVAAKSLQIGGRIEGLETYANSRIKRVRYWRTSFTEAQVKHLMSKP